MKVRNRNEIEITSDDKCITCGKTLKPNSREVYNGFCNPCYRDEMSKRAFYDPYYGADD